MRNHKMLFETVTALVERALAGAIKIDELHHSWPMGADEDPFLARVFEDLEDAVEHFPGYWLSGKPDVLAWKKSREYFLLYLDSLLLRSGEQSHDLISYLDAANRSEFRSEAEVESFLHTRLARGKPDT